MGRQEGSERHKQQENVLENFMLHKFLWTQNFFLEECLNFNYLKIH